MEAAEATPTDERKDKRSMLLADESRALDDSTLLWNSCRECWELDSYILIQEKSTSFFQGGRRCSLKILPRVKATKDKDRMPFDVIKPSASVTRRRLI